MNDLFDNLEEKREEQALPIQEPVDEKTVEGVVAEEQFAGSVQEKGHVKRTVITAVLIFLVPFCAAILLALVARRISPAHIQQREGIAAKALAATNAPAIPSPDAGVAELLQYREQLRERGDNIDFTNLRLWATACREPSLIIEVPAPAMGEWRWSISQDGEYALAIQKGAPENLIKAVALYSFQDEKWIWQRRLPWPEQYEDPWISGGHTILRSSKNDRRFAMEIDEDGRIISLDTLGKGAPFETTPPKLPADIEGTPVALRSNTLFISDISDNSLKGYAVSRIPGLHPAGSITSNSCITGNGLLKFTAADGKISTSDTFTGLQLEECKLWNHSTNTTIQGVAATRDGSKVTVYLRSVFNGDTRIERNWCVYYQPAEKIIETNLTNAPMFTATAPQTEIETPDGKWLTTLHDGNILNFSRKGDISQCVEVALQKDMDCGNDPVQSIELLKDGRYILLKQHSDASLLDLFAVTHYGDLLDRIEQSKRILAAHSDEELSRTNLLDTTMREVQGEERDPFGDNFNYDMQDYYMYFMDPRELAPPGKPSILSLQAEFLATHNAWLYAALKLDRLMLIQEHDQRAPKANPLLLARYWQLCSNKKETRKACKKGLEQLFYDKSDYNRMIRWQLMQTQFDY